MPNLLPDWLPWIQPAGRLIWSVIIFTVGLIFVFALMKPPALKRPFPNAVGYALFAIIPIVGWIIAGLLPDDREHRRLGARRDHRRPRPARPRRSRLVDGREPQAPARRLPGDVGRVLPRRRRHVRADDPRVRRDPARVDHVSPTATSAGATPASSSSSSNQRHVVLPVDHWPFNIDYPAIRDIVVSGDLRRAARPERLLFVTWQKRNVVVEKPAARRPRPRSARASAVRCAAAPDRGPPPARRGGVTDGPHRRQPAHARLRGRLPAPGGRPVVPDRVGEAEAVPPHRPGGVHPLRGLRRHLPVEVHPHGVGVGDRRSGRHRAARRGPARPRGVHRRRGRVHTVRALRRPLPHRRDHPRQDHARHRRRRPAHHELPGTATPTACGSRTQPRLPTRRQVRGERQRKQRERRRQGEGRRRRSTRPTRRSAARRRGTRSSAPARCSGAATPTAPATAPT